VAVLQPDNFSDTKPQFQSSGGLYFNMCHVVEINICLRCFDAVGWVAGKVSSL